MKMTFLLTFLCGLVLCGCGTTGTRRIVYGAAMGASSGAAGGAMLSPNSESRGMNALVFGLTGALVGGLAGLVTDTHPESSKLETALAGSVDLQERNQNYPVSPKAPLPKFVEERLQPVVIEEYLEADHVGEDGSLHEPHKVYRIKQPAELFSRPLNKKGVSQ